jgi:hypothetical protein
MSSNMSKKEKEKEEEEESCEMQGHVYVVMGWDGMGWGGMGFDMM